MLKFIKEPILFDDVIKDINLTFNNSKIDDEKLDRICNLLKDPAVFSYENNFKGNYTTHLIIRLNNKETNISFNKSDLPEDMPKAIKDLLSELNNINN